MRRMKLVFLVLAGVLFYGLEAQQAEAGCTHLGTVGACPLGVSNLATSVQVLNNGIRWDTGQFSAGTQCCPADAGLGNPVTSFQSVFRAPAFNPGPGAFSFSESGPLDDSLFPNTESSGGTPTFRFQPGGPGALDTSLFDPVDKTATPTFRFLPDTDGSSGQQSPPDANPPSTNPGGTDRRSPEVIRQMRREFDNIVQEINTDPADPDFKRTTGILAGLLMDLDEEDEWDGISRSEAAQTDEFIRRHSGSSYGVPEGAPTDPPAGDAQGPNAGSQLSPIIDTQIQQSDRLDGEAGMDSIMDNIESFFVKT